MARERATSFFAFLFQFRVLGTRGVRTVPGADNVWEIYSLENSRLLVINRAIGQSDVCLLTLAE